MIHTFKQINLLYDDLDSEISYQPNIKSFACRGSKLSPLLEAVWERMWPRFGLNLNFIQEHQKRKVKEIAANKIKEKETKETGVKEKEVKEREPKEIYLKERVIIGPAQIFERESNKILEIGFGNGRSLAQMAANSPEKDYIGIEVFRKGIAELLFLIEKMQLSNIRILWGDAAYILNSIKNDSLDGIQIFFSDPWPKTRHHKRRLIQANFVEQVATKLKARGYFHLATDWKDYANHMMSVITNNTKFRNPAGHAQFSNRPDYRPITKYEQRGIRLGHPSWDLIFERQP